jgi:ubiquinone/menaquinone biosynthesis C-methylase UbiE
MTYYDEIAEGYDELHSAEQTSKLAVILISLPRGFEPEEDAALLDVGCGTGISTAFWNCRAIGIDPSERLIEIAKNKYPKTEFYVAVAESIPFPDDHFDMVTSLTAIQNFKDVGKGLDEIKRVAKPDARFILTYLKRSEKAGIIEQEIDKRFTLIKKVEEDKDIILFCR